MYLFIRSFIYLCNLFIYLCCVIYLFTSVIYLFTDLLVYLRTYSCIHCLFLRVFIQSLKRLRWSRGSVLAFGTQVRGFAPEVVGFLGGKNPQHAFLRR